MPIVIKDYSWEETKDTVAITVPLKGVKSNKVDIFSSEQYLKVNFPPFFFESLLHARVDEAKSVANVGNGAVIFKLVKQDEAIWGQLNSPDFADKDVMRQKREEAIRRAHEKSEEDTKEKAKHKREAERYALKEMMKLEQQERARIESEKDSERQKATDEIEQWKLHQREVAEKEKLKLLEEKARKEEAEDNERKKELQEQRKKQKRKKKDIFAEQAKGTDVRQSGKIPVTFSTRVFPTAARESTHDKEEEWLKKQAEARKFAETQDSDLTEEEKNPVWLRDKGNQFFKTGNYQGAINAFSHAIRLDSKMPALFSNRSACHLKLGNFMKAIEDSSKALELLTPPVSQNASSRVKAHVRRGTAFCHMDLYVEGLQEYEAASKIDPANEQLKADADRIRTIIQSSEA